MPVAVKGPAKQFPKKLDNNSNIGPAGLKPPISIKPTKTPATSPNSTATSSKPAAGATMGTVFKSPQPTFNAQDIKFRKGSLKYVEKRESQISATEEDIIVTKSQKKFQKIPFRKKWTTPPKPSSLEEVSLPCVQFTDAETGMEREIGVDIETGVERRTAGGRARAGSEEFQM